MSRPSLDWTDSIAVSRWLGQLRGHLADADAVARDMLRPPRLRELGPVLATERYREARAAVIADLAYATAPEPDGEDDSGASLPH